LGDVQCQRGPDESAVRNAAAANKLPVDSITELPLTLLPK
jgi:hypothetical protein